MILYLPDPALFPAWMKAHGLSYSSHRERVFLYCQYVAQFADSH